jgi:HD-like signal output (HDOD) protein
VTGKLGRKPTDADYGLGEHAIDVDRLGLLDEAELTDRLVKAFSAPTYRPPRLPAVATELLALSQKRDVEFLEVETLLEQDATLAGEVLGIARSAAYSGSRLAGSLHEALVRIGLAKLRQVVMQAAMNLRVFRSATYGDCMERLRRHCRATAHVCRLACRYTPLSEDQAFLAGLMHDVGFAGILLVLGDAPRNKKAPDLTVLWPAINGAHAAAGARMVELWGLPQEMALAVRAHHQVRVEGLDHPLAAVVCLGELIAAELDLGFIPVESDAPDAGALETTGALLHGCIDRSDFGAVERACQALGLTEKMLELMRSDAREWAESELPARAR